MKSTNIKRTLLVSGSVILLCMTFVIGMTVALFTDKAVVNNHLKAGDLNVTLLRTKLDTYSVDKNTGFLHNTPTNTETVDFSTPTARNVFDIVKGQDLIVPCSWYEATMEIGNNTIYATSDVAFSYWIEIKLDTKDLSEKEIQDLKLDEQIKITVTSKLGTSEEKSEWQTLDKGLTIGSEQGPISTVAKGSSESFKVKMEFLDVDDNNLAKTQSLNFDLIVHAVQATTAS